MTDRGAIRLAFGQDPFGYSLMGVLRLRSMKDPAGYDLNLSSVTDDELKSPLLWLAHAHAMTKAAETVIRSHPSWDEVSPYLGPICDSQYCAVGLMLVGYSLEICLKAIIIIRDGVETYTEQEKSYQHHKLEKLSAFIPDLSKKDKAILRLLSHYLYWAGRYPDPGKGKATQLEEIFNEAEKFEIAGKDLFALSAKVMAFVKKVAP